MPLNHLAERVDELPPIARCSCTAPAAIARRSPPASCSTTDSREVSEIAGGIAAWEAANLPVATGADA